MSKIGMKKGEYARACKCLKCGWLPAKTGSDACAKVAMNLTIEARSAQLDYLYAGMVPAVVRSVWAKRWRNCHEARPRSSPRQDVWFTSPMG